MLSAANATLEHVESATTNKDYAEAFRLFATVPDEAKADPAFATRSDADAKQLKDAATAMLAGADQLIADKQYVDAAEKLKSIGKAMADTPTGKQAMQKLSELRSNPAAAQAIATADREEAADAALDVAQKLKSAKKDQQAYVRFKSIVAQYPRHARRLRRRIGRENLRRRPRLRQSQRGRRHERKRHQSEERPEPGDELFECRPDREGEIEVRIDRQGFCRDGSGGGGERRAGEDGNVIGTWLSVKAYC